MNKKKIYSKNPSIFQKYILLTNQKEILVNKICEKVEGEFITGNLSILDIGCGDGIVTVPVVTRLRNLKLNLEVTVIDSSKELLQCFQKKELNGIKYINGDIETLNDLPKSDFVLMSHVVTYINNLESFLEKIMNLLKHNGIALIVLSNDLSDDVRIKKILNNDSNNGTTSSKVQKILKDKQIKYRVEVVKSDIDISGIDVMNNNGKTLIEFFKHKQFDKIEVNEIESMRKIILNVANGNKKLIKREDYIWIKK